MGSTGASRTAWRPRPPGRRRRPRGTLRRRLTTTFAAATALVLLVAGGTVYGLFSAGISGTVDGNLQQREAALRALARRAADPATLRAESAEPLLQLSSPTGALVTSSPALARRPLLTPRQVARGARASYAQELRLPGGQSARARVFPVAGGRLVAVIAESLEREHHLRRRLLVLLSLALPLTLGLATWIAHGLAGAALGPVEQMRGRAALIGDADLSERLPLPAAQDEIARLGRTFNALLDRLAAAFERERRVVSDASHELRTPLAILVAELQVAGRPERTEAQLRDTVASALEETRRLSRLADDLLLLARSDQGGLPLRLEPVELLDALQAARRHQAPAAQRLGRSIEVEVAIDGGAVLLADPDRLGQVLENLMANALRHGEGPVTLRATAPSAEVVAITVADRGPGFGAALPTAFERFAQGDPGRSGGGTGLGLAIVEALVRAHGGEVRAGDRPGGGAQVTVTFPAA